MGGSERVLGVGLLGLGNSGWFYHAEGTLEPSPRFRLQAVCEVDRARADAGAARFGCRGLTDWQDVFTDPEVELVVVALPHHLHRDAVVAAARAGKHVIVEKPMATTTAECEEMIRVAREHQVLLSVFHQRRWDPDFQVLQTAVDSGRIGQVWSVQERRSGAGVYVTRGEREPHAGREAAGWVLQRNTGGGVGYLAGPHLVDHLLALVGRPPLAVSARAHTFHQEAVEHYIDMRLDFDGGVLGQAEINREVALAAPKWILHGTEGSVFSASGSSVHVRRFDGHEDVYEDLPVLRHCDDFYDQMHLAIVDGGPLPVTAVEGRDVVRVLELALQSAASHGEPVAF